MTMPPEATQQPIPANGEDRIPTNYIIIAAVVGFIVFLLVSILIVWLASEFPATIASLKNIFIIALALESCLFGIILVIMLVMIARLVNMLEYEIKPILERTNETVGMVRGTTSFVGDSVVKPVAKARGYVAGARQGFRALFGDPRRNLPD
jgi:fructose-specific phosphotransferase system IIC component